MMAPPNATGTPEEASHGASDGTSDGTAREARRAKRRARRAAERMADNPAAAPPAAVVAAADLAVTAPAAAPPTSHRMDPADHLGDIDAWNLTQDGDWLRFTARLEDHPRAYQRSLQGGDIIADAPGPLWAILDIGGVRGADFTPGPPRFRWNLLAPGDHIGAVGAEGTARTTPAASLLHLPHRPPVACLGDAVLARRFAQKRALPLILTRAETEAAPQIDALRQGTAFANLCAALDSLTLAAGRLGRPARVMAIRLSYGIEDLSGNATGIAEGQRALMAALTAEMRARAILPPPFVKIAETGTAHLTNHPAIRADWELAWAPGPHRLLIAAPAYMAETDAFGRHSDQGRATLAAMEAEALAAHEEGRDWHCPLPLLAEHADRQIRVTFRALSDLVVDPADPFAAGPAAGFALSGPDAPRITAVSPAPDDARALILQLDAPPGPGHRLTLAFGQMQGRNRSAIRDLWQGKTEDGQLLHRWALPADLPLHPAPRQRTPHAL